MKLIPLEQSVINVAKPYIVIAGILALAKKQLEMITVQSHRRCPLILYFHSGDRSLPS